LKSLNKSNIQAIILKLIDFQVGKVLSEFEEELAKMGYAINLQDCRNYLQKCADENKNCIPHLFYFNKDNSEAKTFNSN
jgi:hypothetical protein